MGVADGSVSGATKVVDQGADSSQWNLVILGDGFTSTQQGDFANVVDSFTDILAATAPFSDPALWDRVNVHRIDVVSDETGADDPATCADGTTPFLGLDTVAATYFDAAYCASGLRRLLTVDETLAIQTADDWVPDWDALIVLVNHNEPGGSGSPDVAVASVAGVYDGTIIHELGHAAFGLADEYEYYEGCASGETTQDTYPGTEPLEPNITMEPTALPGKWGQLIDAATPTPTTTNADPATCDTQPSPVADGVIGTFEGAGHYHSGLYRPAFICRMRDAEDDFCAVCANVINIRVLADNPCFLATAVYGDPFAPPVVALRAWRDRCLTASPWRGPMRHVAAFYNRVGPRLARRIRPGTRPAEVLRRLVFDPWARRVARRHEGASR